MTGRNARLLPSAILMAIPMPAPRSPMPCTPSAPILATQSPRPARISSRSLRPSPDTISGCAVMASARICGASTEDGVIVSGRQPREGERQSFERDRIVRSGTAVDTADEIRFRRRREMRHRTANRLLQWMVEVEIGLLRQAALDAVRQHSAVLAGAIVRERRIGRWRRDFAALLVEPGDVRAALEVVHGIARLGQHLGRGGDVARLAGMARAEQRGLDGGKTETPEAVGGHERHRLERLQGAPRHRREVGLAGGEEQLPVAVDDGDRPHVHAVDRVAAHDGDKRRVAAGALGDRRGGHGGQWSRRVGHG